MLNQTDDSHLKGEHTSEQVMHHSRTNTVRCFLNWLLWLVKRALTWSTNARATIVMFKTRSGLNGVRARSVLIAGYQGEPVRGKRTLQPERLGFMEETHGHPRWRPQSGQESTCVSDLFHPEHVCVAVPVEMSISGLPPSNTSLSR